MHIVIPSRTVALMPGGREQNEFPSSGRAAFPGHPLSRRAGMLKTLLLGLALAVSLAAPASRSEAADVAVAIRIDADLVEVIRGYRRAQGLDPPDAEADLRLAAVKSRLHQMQQVRLAAQNAAGAPVAPGAP
jgi:hypothetical protein